MSEVEQDRSERPTSFKLKKAREKGTVARGMDLGFLSGLAAVGVYLWFQGGPLIVRVGRIARDAVVSAPQVIASPDPLLRVTGMVLTSVLQPLVFLAGLTFLTVLMFEIVQTGFVFTTQPMQPDFNRLNPAAGLKRLFSVRLLIETAKNVAKLMVYAAAGALVVQFALAHVFGAITDAAGLGRAMQSTAFRLLITALAAAVLFAAVDQGIARRDFLKKMRMSRREVKRESRDREGDPRMKQRRRQLHGEFVKLSQSLRGINGADVLITNPTHYAVALRYDSKTMVSPTVVSQGSHRIALRLRQLAFLYGVVVVENPPLARALYRLPLDAQVPEALFKPIADIYLEIRKNKQTAEAARTHVS